MPVCCQKSHNNSGWSHNSVCRLNGDSPDREYMLLSSYARIQFHAWGSFTWNGAMLGVSLLLFSPSFSVSVSYLLSKRKKKNNMTTRSNGTIQTLSHNDNPGGKNKNQQCTVWCLGTEKLIRGEREEREELPGPSSKVFRGHDSLEIRSSLLLYFFCDTSSHLSTFK